MWDMVKLLAAVINPTAAKEMFREDGENIETYNENFEADLKKIDPGLDLSACREVLESLDK
jgi:hypothetical protein